LRLSAHNLKKVKAALAQRSAIFRRIEKADETETTKPTEEENIWGEGVKIIRKCTPNRKPFNQAEKEAFVKMYNSGASMGEIARLYKCHHTTVGSILRRMKVEIRS